MPGLMHKLGVLAARWVREAAPEREGGRERERERDRERETTHPNQLLGAIATPPELDQLPGIDYFRPPLHGTF